MSIAKIDGTNSLRTDAAGSYKRMRSAGLPSGGINSAYRSLASQRALFLARYTPQLTGRGKYNDARWYKGKRYVRTSPAGMVAVPGTSTHTTGTALDLSTSSKAHAWMLKNGARHGWKRTIASEPWHWEYAASRDTVLKAQQAAAKAAAAKKAAARAKVKKAQKAMGGLVPDGDPGTRTQAAFDRLRNGSKALKAVQKILGVNPDGIKGTKTKAAWNSLVAATK